MTGYRLAGAAASAICVGSSLMGCGDGPSPAPTPQSVEDAWKNHFNAFATQNVDDIKKDYNAVSVLRQFNQFCPNDKAWTQYVGEDEIGNFFEGLFATLGDGSKVNTPNFTESGDNPIVEPAGKVAVDDTANVFLVWESPTEAGGNIGEATDTFLWSSDFKITKQNIVVYQDGACEGEPAPSGEWDPEKDTAETELIKQGWENHFGAFGNQSITGIMKDYDEDSIIRVFDWREYERDGLSYTLADDLTKIESLFTGLFASIGQDPEGTPNQVNVRLQLREYDFKTVFLVWEHSTSHLRATDTFLFNDAGKIIRQNIVIRSVEPPPGAAQVQAIV